MEERLPPSDHTKDEPPPPPPPPPPAASSLETYVVQIPRNQIYRVPPPEHARFLEQYHNRKPSNQQTTCRGTLFWTAIPVVLLGIIAGIAVLAIRATLYSPTSPEFAVTRIHGKNLEQPLKGKSRRPEFDITLQANNRNTRMSVSYQGGGEASLVFKNQKIGEGGIPSTIKQEPNGGAIDFPVVLFGMPLSMEIKKSLNSATEKSMALMIEVPMEMKSWVRNERMDMKISCDFRVRNSLMNKTKISFQECRTEF